MCGIAGVVRRGAWDPRWLADMARALVHRGPDGQGLERFATDAAGPGGWRAGFAHRRLAVFDRSGAGAQPMCSRSGRTWLVLNGEIYNHPELRRRLPGFAWRSATDTEVLLELLEREGLPALRRVNGMFAFAAWDRARGRLWLGRDRLGVKPLFVRSDRDGIAFASELRALLAGPAFPRRLDRSALSAYLDFGFVPAPRTALEGVEKLAPGHALEWCDGRATRVCWWQLPAAPRELVAGWRERLYARLVDAVHLRLRADVPVGCFLSGGVDSTLLAALAVRERGGIDTFSAGFPEDPIFDESAHARRAARALGTRHWEVPVTAAEIGRAAGPLLEGMDEPFADSSLLPLSLLSRAARSRVTVALAGDGADELFAGYRRYAAGRWLDHWRRLPLAARRGVERRLVARLPDDRGSRLGELGRRARKLVAAGHGDELERCLALARIFARAEKLAVAPGLAAHADAGREHLRALRVRQAGRDDLDTQLRVDLCLGLPDDMLAKVDRGSMQHGLEVRVPFLDHRVVEHVSGLPSAWKRRGGDGKRALLEVFGASLPARVRRRRKAGFDAPLGAWLRGPLRERIRDSLDPARLAHEGVLAPAAVQQLLDAHEARAADHAWRIWSLAVLAEWTAQVGAS